MKRILTIIALLLCCSVQAQFHQLDSVLTSLGEPVKYLQWNMFEYPRSRACNFQLLTDTAGVHRRTVIEKTVLIPDSLIRYLGGANESKIPRWIENHGIKPKED